jgi:Fur family transcriptional regulator, zinc uptake regulator
MAMRRHRVETELNADAALVAAAELLAQRGKKFTAIRRSVLKLLCREPKAVSAYTLVLAFENESGRRIAPNTVYRALDFLQEQGLVAHLLNTRTYVARLPYHDEETFLFFVCSRCGITAECRDPHVERAVRLSASTIGFVAHARGIDLAGICKQCSLVVKVGQKSRRAAASIA